MRSKGLWTKLAVCFVCGSVLAGCYGPFKATKKLHHWNGTVSENKWAQEGVFLLCAWLPVYGLFTLGDALIFNSIEFWTGSNPLDDMGSTSDPEPEVSSRIIEDGSNRVVLERRATERGDEMTVRVFDGERLVEESTFLASGGSFAKLDADGHVVATAEKLAGGSLVVRDASGESVFSAETIAAAAR